MSPFSPRPLVNEGPVPLDAERGSGEALRSPRAQVESVTAQPRQDLTFGGLLLATARPRSLAWRMAKSRAVFEECCSE